MSVVIILVFVAILMAGAFLGAFIWSVKNGQYEDTYTPSVRILFDDPPAKESKRQGVKGKEQKKENEDRKPENEDSRSGQSQ